MKRFLKEFAEVPGACLLAFLALFHAVVVTNASWNDTGQRVAFLNEQIVKMGSALGQTVSVVNALAHENPPYKGTIGVPLPEKVAGEFYQEPKPEGLGHLPWPVAHHIVERIEIWSLLISIGLFLGGLIYRVSIICQMHGQQNNAGNN
jgi:hypothetical protein